MDQLKKGALLPTENTVYLTGSSSSPESEKLSEIKKWGLVLEEKGYKVITPFLLFTDDEKEYSDQQQMRVRIKAMMLCEKVYTLPDWDICEKTKQEVDIARVLKIEVNTVLTLINEKV